MVIINFSHYYYFGINIETQPLVNAYQLIMVVVPLLSIITFSNRDDILFYTLVPNSMVCVTRCCMFVSLSYTLSPVSPES